MCLFSEKQVKNYAQHQADNDHRSNRDKYSAVFVFNVNITWQFAKPVDQPRGIGQG